MEILNGSNLLKTNLFRSSLFSLTIIAVSFLLTNVESVETCSEGCESCTITGINNKCTKCRDGYFKDERYDSLCLLCDKWCAKCEMRGVCEACEENAKLVGGVCELEANMKGYFFVAYGLGICLIVALVGFLTIWFVRKKRSTRRRGEGFRVFDSAQNQASDVLGSNRTTGLESEVERSSLGLELFREVLERINDSRGSERLIDDEGRRRSLDIRVRNLQAAVRNKFRINPSRYNIKKIIYGKNNEKRPFYHGFSNVSCRSIQRKYQKSFRKFESSRIFEFKKEKRVRLGSSINSRNNNRDKKANNVLITTDRTTELPTQRSSHIPLLSSRSNLEDQNTKHKRFRENSPHRTGERVLRKPSRRKNKLEKRTNICFALFNPHIFPHSSLHHSVPRRRPSQFTLNRNSLSSINVLPYSRLSSINNPFANKRSLHTEITTHILSNRLPSFYETHKKKGVIMQKK